MERVRWSWLRRQLWASLGRDGLTRASADESRQLELCRYMWWIRHAAASAFLVLGLRDGIAERAEHLTALVFILQTIGHAWSATVPRRAGLVAVLDAVAFMLLSALGLPPVLVFLLAVAILGWSATFRPVPAAASCLAVLTAVGLMLGRADDLSTKPVIAAFCLLSVIFMMRTIRLNIGARRAAEREQLVSERVDAVLWEQMPGTDTIKVSPAAERILGYPVPAWGEPGFWRSLVHPDDLAGFDVTSPVAQPLRLRRADGTWRWMESRSSQVTDRQGRHAFFVGVLSDRTEQVEAEREALAFGHLVALSPIGQVLLTSTDDRALIEAVNPAGQRALGLSPDAVRTRWSDWANRSSMSGPGRSLSSLLAATAAQGKASIEFTGADGRTYQADGRRVDPSVCIIDLIDVTERVEAGRRLHTQARQDDLTGLPNRRAFLETLDRRLVLDDGSTALLVLDLDDFKEINDSLGHLTGDDLLRSIGRRILGWLRESEGEVAARLGGDEFAVILPGLGAAAAAVRGQELAEAISAPIEIGDLRLRVRASMGIAEHPSDAMDVDELIRRADIAMYQAKSQGADPHHYNAANDQFSTERITLAADLDTAIATSQLTLHHQPLVDLATGRVIGTEALVRWQHPTMGTIAPGRFIELAEVSGQMKHLTRWVIRQALTDLRDLGDAADDLEVSVNLSVRNLYETDFLAWLSGTLADLGVPGERLVVEITEGTVMVDYAVAVHMIEAMRGLGVRTWIDDFGTGHSSLARLRNLPVDGVKIDRAFVDGATQSPQDRDVLGCLIELVDSLGLQTIAEGVESGEGAGLLQELGCDLAQGYHFGPPEPVPVLRERLARQRQHRPARRAPSVPRPAGPRGPALTTWRP